MAKQYALNGDKVAEAKFGVQAALIVKALEDKSPDTVKGIADRIKGELVTRQPAERVVNFYLSTWKKKGLVEVVGEINETPVSTGNSSSDEGAGDTADETIMQRAPGPEGFKPFDVVNSTMKEAVLHMIDKHPGQNAQDIAQHLQVAGRTVTPKQVADSVSKLLKAKQVTKDENGLLNLVTE